MINLTAIGYELKSGTAASEDIFRALKQKDMDLELLLRKLMQFAELDEENIEQRLTPLMLQQCLIHLADDLADGECDYMADNSVADNIARGATSLCSLQNMVSLALLASGVSTQGIKNFYSQMLKVGAAQHEETRTLSWNLQSSREAACGLNAELFSAYLTFIWEDTQYCQTAAHLGYHFGIACHVATDIRSKDIRYLHLSLEDRQTLRDWALESANLVYDAGVPPLRKHILSAYRYLR